MLGSDTTHPATMNALFNRLPIRNGWAQIPAFFGDRFHNFDGDPLRRGVAFNSRLYDRLPVLLNNRRCIASDFIPTTSWGSSLANLLTRKSWDRLRHLRNARNNDVCECCGTVQDSLENHEIWSYHLPQGWETRMNALAEGQQLFGVQRLDDIWPVCHPCHECFHLGFALKSGRFDAAVARLCGINQWDNVTFERYYETAGQRLALHSDFLWALDLELVAGHPDGGLTIRAPWAISEENPVILKAPPPPQIAGASPRITVLLNATWRFASDPPEVGWRTPLPPSLVLDD